MSNAPVSPSPKDVGSSSAKWIVYLVIGAIVLPLFGMCCIVGSVSLYVFERRHEQEMRSIEQGGRDDRGRSTTKQLTVIVRSGTDESDRAETVSRATVTFRSEGGREFKAMEATSGRYYAHIPNGRFTVTVTHPDCEQYTDEYRTLGSDVLEIRLTPKAN
jgi:hypothetical protein